MQIKTRLNVFLKVSLKSQGLFYSQSGYATHLDSALLLPDSPDQAQIEDIKDRQKQNKNNLDTGEILELKQPWFRQSYLNLDPKVHNVL